MSKSIYATVCANTEKIIFDKENKIKEEFLNFLNVQLEELIKELSKWTAQRAFKIPNGESHYEFKAVAEKMGFVCQYEIDGYYGDTIELLPKGQEAMKLVEAFNKKVDMARREEQKRKERIKRKATELARKVAKEILGKLKTNDYKVEKYNDKSCTIKVEYEQVSFEGTDSHIFVTEVQNILSKYNFSNSSFGGTANNYFNIILERESA